MVRTQYLLITSPVLGYPDHRHLQPWHSETKYPFNTHSRRTLFTSYRYEVVAGYETYGQCRFITKSDYFRNIIFFEFTFLYSPTFASPTFANLRLASLCFAVWTKPYRDCNDILLAKLDSVACPFTILQLYINLAQIDLNSSDFLFKAIFKSKSRSDKKVKN